jgi:energy-coupling factor transporter ATP-binding protein EcfA2
VLVDEPSVEDTIAILRGLKERYEVHHGVEITDPAIVAAATLSHRYITDRQLPDKAIDLIDEAAARIRMEIDSKPEEMDKLDRRIIQLKIEREALKKEPTRRRRSGCSARGTLAELEKEYADLEESGRPRRPRCRARRPSRKSSRRQARARAARRKGDLARMASCSTASIPELEKRSPPRRPPRQGERARAQQVTEEEIAEVVSRGPAFRSTKMLEGEKEKLLRMEEALGKRVVGQEEAVRRLERDPPLARRPQDPNRPNGSFLFLGPTGVGKTELCKALAEFLFDTEEAMVRIDMSEFMEKHSVARLIGAPPGLRRLRRGRLPHRGGAAPAVCGDPARRGREGAPGRVQRAAAGARRRPPDRRPGPHGRLPQHRHHHDLEPRLERDPGTGGRGELRAHEERGDGDRAAALPARVHQPHRRHRRVPSARPEQIRAIVDIQLGCLRKRLAERDMELELDDAARDLLGEAGFDPGVWRAAAEARDPAADRESAGPAHAARRWVRATASGSPSRTARQGRSLSGRAAAALPGESGRVAQPSSCSAVVAPRHAGGAAILCAGWEVPDAVLRIRMQPAASTTPKSCRRSRPADDQVPVLRQEDGFKKLISAPVFRLKGSGWYETDFKSDKENKRNLAGADAVAGWVHRRRDHGGVIFVDLRDREGLLQVVFDPDQQAMFAEAERCATSSCVRVHRPGARPPRGHANANLASGKVELLARSSRC